VWQQSHISGTDELTVNKPELEVAEKGSGMVLALKKVHHLTHSKFIILHNFILKIIYKQVRCKIYLDAKIYS
jgi:hypothetical protein